MAFNLDDWTHESITAGGQTYTRLIAYKGTDTELVIPAGYAVGVNTSEYVGQTIGLYTGGATSVTFEDGVVLLSAAALFCANSMIESVTFKGVVKPLYPNYMDYMFYGCYSLTTLDVSGFDTSRVTGMSGMFEECESLTSLDVSGWDTSNVTNMLSMFYYCRDLTDLDVSSWDTSKVTSMDVMFTGCSSLTALDVSGWDTSRVTGMSGMFNGCSSLTALDVSGFDTSNVTYMNSMFNGCSSLTALDVSGWDTSNVTRMGYMFEDCSSLTALDVSGWDTSNVTYMNGMFYNCSSLTTLDVSGFDTSRVTGMSYMFEDCSSLTALDVSGFDTSNVTRMDYMFEDCRSLTDLDVSGWDTSNVTRMDYMFENCSSLTALDVSGWDTSNVTSMEFMFYNCSSLTTLDVSGFDTSNVTSMGYMFKDCRSLTALDVSGFDTSNVTRMGSFIALDVNTSMRLIIGKMFDKVPTSTSLRTALSGGYQFYTLALVELDIDNTSGRVSEQEARGWYLATSTTKTLYGNAPNGKWTDYSDTTAGGSPQYTTAEVIDKVIAGEHVHVIAASDPSLITFDANGGEDAPAGMARGVGETITLPLETPTRAQYVCTGWAISSTGTAVYQPGQTLTAPASLELFAVWVVAYTPPSISNAKVTRCESDGTASDTGDYIKVTFNWSTSSTVDSTGNTYPATAVTVTVSEYGTDDGTITSGTISSASPYAGTFSSIIADVDHVKAWRVVMSVTDGQQTVVREVVVPDNRLWIDFSPEGGVAIGGDAAPDADRCVICNEEGAEFTNRSDTLARLAQVGSYTAGDFNDFTEPGVYHLGAALSKFTNYPTCVASTDNYGTLYVAVDSAGNINQLFVPDNGANRLAKRTTTNQGAAWNGWTSTGLDAYPVGAVYISYVNTSPASLFGGTWTQITGRFLRMANDVSTGGADSVSHNHWQTVGRYSSEVAYIVEGKTSTSTRVISSAWVNTVNTTSMGGNHNGNAREDATYSTSVNNMPAYQDLYAWRRTA